MSILFYEIMRRSVWFFVRKVYVIDSRSAIVYVNPIDGEFEAVAVQ